MDAYTRHHPEYKGRTDALDTTPDGWFQEQGQYLADHLPIAHLELIDGANHFPWFAKHDLIVAAAEEFVTGSSAVVASDRALATLLFVDIVGSTALAAELGDRGWQEVKRGFYRLVRRQLPRFRGVEVDAEGDGIFMRFDSPVRAGSCACAIRDGVHSLGLQIRAGVHTGEIELHDEDVTGLAVHIAARIRALAEPDEVLASRTVKDLVVGSGISFEERGIHELKGVPDAWQVYAVSA
jgi:class 3 adenylate cyclase